MHIEHRAQALLPDIRATYHGAAESPRANADTARLTCIVPAYNEADNLSLLLPTLATTLDIIGLPWEVIVVDDGSQDATAQVMQRWTARRGVTWLRLSRNFGKEAAISAGLEAARGDIVVCLDADMQHPPALIAAMVARWRQGIDMVYAQRTDRRDEAWTKRMGTRLFYSLLAKGHRVRIPEHAGDFRLMDRKVVDALVALPERSRFMKGLYAWVGFEAEALPYVPAPRARGTSHFSLVRLVALAMDGLTSFTTWPLRMISLAGMVLAFLAFGYGVELTIEYATFGNQVSGWTTLITALLFFAGVNMFSLGIVGEYVGRIFDEVKGRPLYVVRSRMGAGLEATPAAHAAQAPAHVSGARVELH
ncbi:MAG: glycosyltransferase family 2 protein [Burkholderiaceae bacterium]